MSSKFGMAGGIPERRVRPIWDAVDSRQFKAALKLSTALLSKYPKSPYAIALKGLILERMGKPDEALSVCIDAKERLYSNDVVIVDDLTLSTLQIVFARLDRLDLATSCYEYACGKFPNNVELMMGLFNCYVREYSFVKQQQTAIKMYKVVGEERFLLWAVCSIQLQVLSGTGGEKLLLLAEGLLKKHVASHSLHEPEALLLYISILEQQAKYGDALEILSGKLGSLLIIEVDRLRIQGRLLARLCDHPAAAAIFKKILEICPDDWECFLNYLGCLLEDDSRWCSGTVIDQLHPSNYVSCKLSHLNSEKFDSLIENASHFMQKIQIEDNTDFVRCPYLANLEIERRKRLYGKIEDGRLSDSLLKYFCRFGHMSCFTTDVEMFLQVMSHEEKMTLVEKFNKSCESSTTSQAKQLGQSITIFKIQEAIGTMASLSSDELECMASHMADIYCKNLPLSKDLDLQENMHGEDLLSMSSNVLVQLFWRTRNIGYLLEAIMVLEFGLTIRRHVWQYKILLLHLYSHLSAFPLAYEWYKTLDIKNILLETAVHHILPQMLVSPLWVDLSDILKDYLRFMDDHFRESADLTFLAYRHRTYTKAIEFVQFKERLQHSHQYLIARLEAAILQLKQKADNIEEEESILESFDFGIQLLELSSDVTLKSLTFNDDIRSRPWWTPAPDKNLLLEPSEGKSICRRYYLQKQAEESGANVRKVIERRCLLPRLIYLSIVSASSSIKESVDSNGSISDGKNSLELKSLLERYARSLGRSFTEAVEEIVEVSNGQKSAEVFGSNLVDWLNFAVFFNAWKLGSHEVVSSLGDECRSSSWILVSSLIEKFTVGKLKSMKPLIQSPGIDIPLLVQIVTEPMAWHSIVLQSCIRSILPSGKKKKKSGQTDNSNSSLFQEIHSSVQSLCDMMEEVTQWLNEQLNTPEEENLNVLLSYLPGRGCNQGPGKVLQVLEALASSSTDLEHGDRISKALCSWRSNDILRKIVIGQRNVLSEFHHICKSKLPVLHSLRQQY
ncbi:N-alpha-acetyltransferase 25, NatB auxiliary subunit [Thalictrum thalictroides]|uniref:N-alpha-acetyltransferase 25, NatB auxiliary subunit n=1 Tax=Thalictrum thalictroides TaxID=46969 RepID=A0A7J6VVW2_THATH|nr:N-alpha-acetyltransferase 25, NatB auxiliary subunit [Thalictrum thalictroides]